MTKTVIIGDTEVIDNTGITPVLSTSASELTSTEVFSLPTTTRKKRGQKPFKLTPKILDKIYEIVLKGAVYHNQIYPMLCIGHDTFAQALNTWPEIKETIDQAKMDRMEKVMGHYDNALYDPSSRHHAKVLVHAVDTFHKLNAKPNEPLIVINNTPVHELKTVSRDDLTDLLENNDD